MIRPHVTCALCYAVFGLFADGATHAQPAEDACAPPHYIAWPAGAPVWSLCWFSPIESSGIDGSGIELRNVSYKGHPVLRRAGLPLLNVNYDPGGCGAYRDWQNGLMDFEADGIVDPPGSRYAEPTRPPRTMCDDPDQAGGNFQGVAAEKTAQQLVLTTQLQSGPYRYTQKWIFRLDGSIDARIAFTARVDPCNVKPHNHHAYWRFEFDIGGDGKDYAEARTEHAGESSFWKRIVTETSFRNDALHGGAWHIQSASAPRGYEILSSSADGRADAWAVADAWLLKFHSEELDDGGARPGRNGSAVQLDRYLNGEALGDTPLVLWVHAMDRHAGQDRCRFVGPTLRPIGQW